MQALADLCATQGYQKTTVAHITARAQTSRNTFYELFHNKEELFLTLIDFAASDLIRGVESHCTSRISEEAEALDVGLAAILEWTSKNPGFAWVLFVEAPVGPERAFDTQIKLFGEFAEKLRQVIPGESPVDSMGDLLVGGIASILRGVLLSGGAPRAPRLLSGLLTYLRQPYQVSPPGEKEPYGPDCKAE
jgi:AcrR family transcriptional regulator